MCTWRSDVIFRRYGEFGMRLEIVLAAVARPVASAAS
jgi:hypothetical protein